MADGALDTPRTARLLRSAPPLSENDKEYIARHKLQPLFAHAFERIALDQPPAAELHAYMVELLRGLKHDEAGEYDAHRGGVLAPLYSEAELKVAHRAADPLGQGWLPPDVAALVLLRMQGIPREHMSVVKGRGVVHASSEYGDVSFSPFRGLVQVSPEEFATVGTLYVCKHELCSP